MHFLNKIIEHPQLKDPFINHIDIHRHFYRYGKGKWIGPSAKITKTRQKITIRSSFEYEDLIQEIVFLSNPSNKVSFQGTLYTMEDAKDQLHELGLNWQLQFSRGKTSNYKATVQESRSTEDLLSMINAFRYYAYFLISFDQGVLCKVTTKTRMQKPSNKWVEDGKELAKRLKFCVGTIQNTENNLKLVLNKFIPDFYESMHGIDSWKYIIIQNTYNVKELDFPEEEDSRLLRMKAIRKGSLIREIAIDNQLSFSKTKDIIV